MLLLIHYNTVPSPPTNVTYFHSMGGTTLNMSWTPPTPLEDVTGYVIYYNTSDNGSLSNVSVSNSLTDNYLLTGLQTGVTYSVFMVALSEHLPSEVVTAVEVKGSSSSEVFQATSSEGTPTLYYMFTW